MSDPTPQSQIRNFSIIAHVDHGKSTLADKLLLRTQTLGTREFRHDQILDDMDIERERGITIKARAVRMSYDFEGTTYQLNLVDTPGHVDFSYEVSRSLAACEGALLVVDAAQGIGAQTVANTFLALEHDLTIIPVLNKIDLPTARPEEVAMEVEHVLGLPTDEALHVSAKAGIGIDELLAAIIRRVPAPTGDPNAPLRALIFDAAFDDYRGVVIYIRVMDGSVKPRDRVQMIGTGGRYEVIETGIFRPNMEPIGELRTGETGYLICNIKLLSDVSVGDTVTGQGSSVVALPGYKRPKAVVFCGVYPSAPNDYDNLRKALGKLHLNDCSFTWEPETSEALGFGFRCGFLGLLHMEIVQERLERESGIDIVQTAPNVSYEVLLRSGEVKLIDSPAKLPDEGVIDEIREPMVRLSIITPTEHLGQVMSLCVDRHAEYKRTEYLSPERVMLTFEIALSTIIFDFYDKLKSITRGYGTMDYEILGYKAAPLVKLRILVAGTEVDALSAIIHSDEAERFGRRLIEKLRGEIPRHLFEVALQAAIGARVIARENIKAMRKDVTAKCYGGDISRKRKLLEKQKAGKRRMRSVGNVEIPQGAFFAALKIDRD
ncbi:MAG: elongation factor 4 [Planctomycetes bacterium]|nr:elongation factor 4 [Planctomycetota bacterium]